MNECTVDEYLYTGALIWKTINGLNTNMCLYLLLQVKICSHAFFVDVLLKTAVLKTMTPKQQEV